MKLKKQKQKKEECGLVIYTQNKGNQWYIDNGCSKHMTVDQTNFLTLKKEKIGNFTFQDNASTNIVGKGIVSVNDGNIKT